MLKPTIALLIACAGLCAACGRDRTDHDRRADVNASERYDRDRYDADRRASTHASQRHDRDRYNTDMYHQPGGFFADENKMDRDDAGEVYGLNWHVPFTRHDAGPEYSRGGTASGPYNAQGTASGEYKRDRSDMSSNDRHADHRSSDRVMSDRYTDQSRSTPTTTGTTTDRTRATVQQDRARDNNAWSSGQSQSTATSRGTLDRPVQDNTRTGTTTGGTSGSTTTGNTWTANQDRDMNRDRDNLNRDRTVDQNRVDQNRVDQNRMERDRMERDRLAQDNRNTRDNREMDRPRDAMGMMDFSSLNAEARVLSVLHAKNIHEIAMGRCAQMKGQSEDVRDYGKDLVSDHNKADDELVEVARKARINVLAPDEGKELAKRELHGGTMPPKEAKSDFNRLSGTEFDRAFAGKMAKAHRDLIRYLEGALPQIQNNDVKEYVNRTLGTLREHAEHAERLD